MTRLTEAPQFRLFKLGIDEKDAAELKTVGYHNLKQSIELESGTLAMYSSYQEQDQSQRIVIELYRDEAAYQEHIASEHFKAFATFAQTAIKSREVLALDPALLLEKPEPLRVLEDSQLSVRLATIVVDETKINDFKTIVFKEMEEAITVEDGVLVMYCGQVADHPNTFYFFEIYQDEAAYQSHRETPHFKNYIEQTASMVVKKELSVLKGEQLVNKGGIHYS